MFEYRISNKERIRMDGKNTTRFDLYKGIDGAWEFHGSFLSRAGGTDKELIDYALTILEMLDLD